MKHQTKTKNMNIGYLSDVSEHENKLEYNEKNSQTVKEEYIDEKIDKSPYKSNSDVVTSSNGPEEFLMKKIEYIEENIDESTYKSNLDVGTSSNGSEEFLMKTIDGEEVP